MEDRLFENSIAKVLLVVFIDIELAFEEDNLEQVQQVHLHGVVLVFDALLKSPKYRVNDEVSYLVACLRMGLK